ncbi:hypothetical protein GQ53DRAFT_365477 [Thozetella sp. PMI_491]|nr:hypothetical protein GQ53DRAFT_365477 [Thozetella sp. PMI_491]
MVYSSSPQPPSTYELGRLFWMPMEGGSQRAFSVSSYVAYYLISVYTILVTTMVVTLWCLVFACFLYLRLRQNKQNATTTALWNKRYSIVESLLELLQYNKANNKRWKQAWFAPTLAVVLTFLAGHIALSILVPSIILIDRAAPVNPNSVVVPNNKLAKDGDARRKTQVFTADTPAIQRAVGSAQVAPPTVQSMTSVTMTSLGNNSNGEVMNRYEYSYSISGRDMGLQNFPTLMLAVTGACITEYGWLNSTNQTLELDWYNSFGNTSNPMDSPFGPAIDGDVPVAYFYPGPYENFTLWETNMTWAAYISSAYRYSYFPGTDPFYLTEQINEYDPNDLSIFPYAVKAGRPVLSCWEQNLWSYGDHTSNNTLQVNSDTLPGLGLPHSIQLIFARYLGIPKIVSVGGLLYLSSLQSGSRFSLGSTFDASQSSMLEDLKRLVLTAYIATTNMLTDTTLYADVSPTLDNMATDKDGAVLDGVGDFVVWTGDVAALSLKYIILIPSLALTMWLFLYIALHFTRLRLVRSLDASVLHETMLRNSPDARPHNGGWRTEKDCQEATDMAAQWTAYAPPQAVLAGAPETTTAYDPHYGKPLRDSGFSTGTMQVLQPFPTSYPSQATYETVSEVYDTDDGHFGMISPASAAGMSTRQDYFSIPGHGNEAGSGYIPNHSYGQDVGQTDFPQNDATQVLVEQQQHNTSGQSAYVSGH